MRRTLVVIMALFAALVITTPVSAAGNAFKFAISGPGAEALWSTTPANPVPGVVYTDTYLNVANQTVTFDGETFQGSFLFVDRFSYKFDSNGTFIPVSEVSGDAEGPSVSLAIDANKLTSASASATVAITTCSYKGNNVLCSQRGTASVSASWTGTGDIQHVSSHFLFKGPGTTDNDHFRGTFRAASATGQYDNTNLGTSVFADIFNTTEADIFICHGC